MSLGEKLRGITDKLGVSISDGFNLDKLTKLNRQKATNKPVYVKSDLEIINGGITLIPLADLHIGNIYTDKEKLQSILDYIEATPGCYTVLLGDLAENATKTSVGLGMYEEDIHLKDQLIVLADYLRPLADKGKILGIHPGNHEFRSALLTGINPMELLAERLKVPYLHFQAFHVLNVGDQSYQLMTSHGVGSGRSSGAKINAAERPSEIVPLCHVYLTGHSHIRSVHEKMKYKIEADRLATVKQFFIVCGSFLTYFGGYPEMQMLPPTPTGVVSIKFHSESHNISVSV